MRIGTLQLFRQGVNSILDQQTRLAGTQLQLASGKRINKPSDDPTGAAQLLGLSESLKVTGQYQKNIDYARSRLELEDAALGSVGDALQRARELAVQGLNDTNGAEDRAAIAKEIRQLTDEVMGLANRKDANGEYLFGGHQGQNAPFSHDGSGTFSYTGDQGQRRLQVGPARQISDSDSGLDVFMKVPASGGGFERPGHFPRGLIGVIDHSHRLGQRRKHTFEVYFLKRLAPDVFGLLDQCSDPQDQSRDRSQPDPDWRECSGPGKSYEKQKTHA